MCVKSIISDLGTLIPYYNSAG